MTREMDIDLCNKEFSVTAYDGYAKYRVAATYGDGTVQIESVPQIVDGMDVGYTAPLLGEGCRIEARAVREWIEHQERFRRAAVG